MTYRSSRPAPASRVAADRRGPVVGRYCLVCHAVYPNQRGFHRGRPVYGRDHVSSPCTYEGAELTDGAEWWEPAVEVLPAPAVVEPEATQAAPA
jgi:hypothetical protein